MNCQIIKEIKDSGIKSWINANCIEDKKLLVSWQYTCDLYERDEKIPTAKLCEDLESLYQDLSIDYGSYYACYQVEQNVLCLRPSESKDKWKEVNFVMHEEYPVIPNGDIFENGKKVGTVEKYSPIEHFGKVTLDSHGPDSSEMGTLSEIQIVKVSDVEIERPGYVFQRGLWQWAKSVKDAQRRFDDTDDVEQLDIPLLLDRMEDGIRLGKYDEVIDIGMRIISEKQENFIDLDALHYAYTRLIAAEIVSRNENVFYHFEVAFENFQQDEDLTNLLVKLFEIAGHHSKWGPLILKLIETELVNEDKYHDAVKELGVLDPTIPHPETWMD